MKKPRLSMEGKILEQFIIDVLAWLREARGMTVAELARRSGIGESQLGKVLRGERALKADEFIRLCFVFRARVCRRCTDRWHLEGARAFGELLEAERTAAEDPAKLAEIRREWDAQRKRNSRACKKYGLPTQKERDAT